MYSVRETYWLVSILTKKLTDITKAQLLTWRLGVLHNEDKVTSAQISMVKRNNVDITIDIAREARHMLGGVGITGVRFNYETQYESRNLSSINKK